MIKRLLFILTILIGFSIKSQNVAIKTNIITDGFLNPNAAVEMKVKPRWTVELEGDFNIWKLSHDRTWKHWGIQPEGRYWLCDEFSGHFIGMHLLGGQYNIGGINIPVNFLGTNFKKLNDSRFQGWFVGAGIGYGYAWSISKNFNIETEIGVGWTYTRYDQFKCKGCGKRIKKNATHNYVGPTKLSVNLEYVF